MAKAGSDARQKLVAESFAPRAARECWAQSLTGEARLYLQELEAAVANGKMPVWARVRSILNEHFGVAVTVNPVASHLRGECRCRRA